MTEESLVRSVLQQWTAPENSGNEGDPAASAAEKRVRVELLALIGDSDALKTEIGIFLRHDPAQGFARWKMEQRTASKLRFKRIFFGWPAAVVLMLLLEGSLFFTIWHKFHQPVASVVAAHRPPAVPSFKTLETSHAEQNKMDLPDGSRVWLNNASHLRYPTRFNNTARTVELTGEAYFEVAANAGKPFVVKTNKQEVMVLATSFDIKAYPDETEAQTTVVTGKIEVRTKKGTVILKAGERLRLDTANRSSIETNVEAERVLSWKDGFIYYGPRIFKESMRQAARWYDVNVVYSGNIPEMHSVGEFHLSQSLDELLKFLEKNHIHCRLQGHLLIVQ